MVPVDRRWRNEPGDRSIRRCGHNYDVEECPWQVCGYRDALEGINSLVAHIAEPVEPPQVRTGRLVGPLGIDPCISRLELNAEGISSPPPPKTFAEFERRANEEVPEYNNMTTMSAFRRIGCQYHASCPHPSLCSERCISPCQR